MTRIIYSSDILQAERSFDVFVLLCELHPWRVKRWTCEACKSDLHTVKLDGASNVIQSCWHF
jgi:hypothetical protein